MLARFHATCRRSVVTLASFVLTLMVAFGGPSSASALADWPLMKNGQRGPNVKTLQYLLLDHGYSLGPVGADGIFGDVTEAQVKEFQRANGLTDDGQVGSFTWPKLVVTVDYGMGVGEDGDDDDGEGDDDGKKGRDAVRALQVQLNKHGNSLVVDGAYGANTRAAVLAFKEKNFLGGGTTVGPTTWQALLGSGNGGGGSGGYALPLDRNRVPRSEYDDPHHDYPAIDLQIPSGTPLYAVTSGTVTRIQGGSCGNGYSLTGNDGATYTYCHLSRFVALSGATVNAGDLLGYSGNTGNSTGPHLHLAIKYDGSRRCPQSMLLAIYDGTAVPTPSTLPKSGCTYKTVSFDPDDYDGCRGFGFVDGTGEDGDGTGEDGGGTGEDGDGTSEDGDGTGEDGDGTGEDGDDPDDSEDGGDRDDDGCVIA
jgi:peptidoglycan hydrolase-like protein with peptidoglycan-binding domain